MKTTALYLLGALSLALLSSSPLHAETLDKQSLGYHYTSNAYLTPDSPVADSYLLLNSRYKFQMLENPLAFRLDFADYLKESDNDYLRLNLNTKWPSLSRGSFRSLDFYLRLFHKNYLHENVATSDNSFTHTGAGLDMEREWQLSPTLQLTAGAGYETRYFHDFRGRNDHQFMVLADMDFYPGARVSFHTSADLGLTLSSLAAYSATFTDLGAGAKGLINKDLEWISDLDIRAVAYVNRTVDEAVEVGARRGTLKTVTVSEIERTQSLSLSGGLKWTLSKNFDLEGRCIVSKQSSNNPNFAYQNQEAVVSVMYLP